MELNLRGVDMTDLVSAALLTHLKEEDRNILIQQAIKSLIEPGGSNGYGQKTDSVLQRAFKEAIIFQAERLVRTKLEEDEAFKSTLDGLIQEAFRKFSDDNREETVDNITKAIRKGFTGLNY